MRVNNTRVRVATKTTVCNDTGRLSFRLTIRRVNNRKDHLHDTLDGRFGGDVLYGIGRTQRETAHSPNQNLNTVRPADFVTAPRGKTVIRHRRRLALVFPYPPVRAHTLLRIEPSCRIVMLRVARGVRAASQAGLTDDRVKAVLTHSSAERHEIKTKEYESFAYVFFPVLRK